MSGRYWTQAFILAAAVAALVTSAAAQEQGTTREFVVRGNQYAFAPSDIRVSRNDLVKITFTAQDIPHSFTIDDYRISKRAGQGQTVTFEFRADHAGRFTYYCNLSQDAKCRDMKGTLLVE